MNPGSAFDDSLEGDNRLEEGLRYCRELVDDRANEFPIKEMKKLANIQSIVKPGIDTFKDNIAEDTMTDFELKTLFALTTQALMEAMLVAFVEGLDEMGASDRLFNNDPGKKGSTKNSDRTKLALMSDLDIHNEVNSFLDNL